ncbi:MAG: hypothetical protein AAB250_05785 [Bdellovibrionota bacterium]
MKSLILIATLLVSTAALAGPKEPTRLPSTPPTSFDSALKSALTEQEQSWRAEDDRSVTRSDRDEQKKIFIELGDEG